MYFECYTLINGGYEIQLLMSEDNSSQERVHTSVSAEADLPPHYLDTHDHGAASEQSMQENRDHLTSAELPKRGHPQRPMCWHHIRFAGP